MSSTPEQDTPEAASLAVEAVDENIAIIARQAMEILQNFVVSLIDLGQSWHPRKP